MDAWKLIDYTKKGGGYLQLAHDGRRVCDFFPFAKGADEQWVRAQANLIYQTMRDKQPAAPASEWTTDEAGVRTRTSQSAC